MKNYICFSKRFVMNKNAFLVVGIVVFFIMFCAPQQDLTHLQDKGNLAIQSQINEINKKPNQNMKEFFSRII